MQPCKLPWPWFTSSLARGLGLNILIRPPLVGGASRSRHTDKGVAGGAHKGRRPGHERESTLALCTHTGAVSFRKLAASPWSVCSILCMTLSLASRALALPAAVERIFWVR